MQCPFCSHTDTRVLDSRVNENEVRRRRECEKCEKRFTTYETAELDLTVLKKDGQREKFDREKIKNGLLRACNKRPVPVEQIEIIATKIEQRVRGRQEVRSSTLGQMVMKELLRVDKIAYVRFASVCKAFDDPKLFEKELALLKD